ncbi:MAG: hypothetical protein V3T77_10175, partial [Planctomycetota bacterium]
DEGGRYRLTGKQLADRIDPIPQVIRGLEVGAVSERVVTDLGVHYFRLEEKVEGKKLTFKEAQMKIRSRIVRERRRQQEARFEKELRESADISIFIPGVTY